MSMETPRLTNGVATNQTIRQAVTDQRFPLGTRGVMSDGRAFRYASNEGIALVAGQFCQSEAIGANFINVAVATAAAVEATSVDVTLGGSETVVANAYEGGYLVINDAAGEGISYRIIGNTAVAAGTALTLTLDEGVHVALTTSSQACVLKSQWAAVVIAAAGHVHHVAGVPQFAVPAGSTDIQYFWLQTWGLSAGEDDATTAVGAALQSGTTTGQAEVNVGAAQLIGTQLVTGVATEFRPKILSIAP